MRIVIIAAACLGLAGLTSGASAAAPSMPSSERAAPTQAPARNAFDAGQTGADQSCMNGSRLLSHAAYVPAGAERAVKCGQLLSTDTLVTVHRWDHT